MWVLTARKMKLSISERFTKSRHASVLLAYKFPKHWISQYDRLLSVASLWNFSFTANTFYCFTIKHISWSFPPMDYRLCLCGSGQPSDRPPDVLARKPQFYESLTSFMEGVNNKRHDTIFFCKIVNQNPQPQLQIDTYSAMVSDNFIRSMFACILQEST